MSEEMAVVDNAASDETKVNGDAVAGANAAVNEPTGSEGQSAPAGTDNTESTSEDDKQLPNDGDTPSTAEPEPSRGTKRRASDAFSDKEEFQGFGDGANPEEQFKGFSKVDEKDLSMEYRKRIEPLEAEVTAAAATLTPVRSVSATPKPAARANKRLRTDTDGSRPSSALSSRSDGDGFSIDGSSRRKEISSPLLRVPLAQGWKRELVYRAALDHHSRRNADVYYYSPQGKKLRSTREVAEYLGGSDLTLDNFSFFKEPLGVDDPEKEIIRDAKLMRKTESPVSTPAPLPERRTPKPKPPKGAEPEPAIKSPPAKIKVKSMGSRLSGSGPAPAQKPAPKKQPADNNNSAAWKKPSERSAEGPPPPLQCRPQPAPRPPIHDNPSGALAQRPCSLACGGVPSLSCAACLCLYHPRCLGLYQAPPGVFYCKNCRKSTSPPREPPPLVQAPPKRPSAPPGRGTLRMKLCQSSLGQTATWSVSRPRVPPPAVSRPQSLAVINGRRFIVVPRSAQPYEEKQKKRVNGAAPPPSDATSPRRRGRKDDTDHFASFYDRAKETNIHVVVQIFQYLGMRELGQCARVCRLWRSVAATPQLWRHVRMKNSHVSDWAGLCAALKRHGTKRLDLRKMLLPQNDTVFWEQFAKHIGSVDSLERLEMCRCPASAVESVCRSLPNLRSLSALAIRDGLLDPTPLSSLTQLQELRLKSLAGLALTRDLMPLTALTQLTHLSLTSIKDLGWWSREVVGSLKQLESLELGECSLSSALGVAVGSLRRLKRLRLERGTQHEHAPPLLRQLATLPDLTSLELVNVDVKVGFDDALAECKNIQRLLIIPTYVSQSATTNKQVLSGVLRLKDSLTHLMWGVTIELLRVTELFIDQCSAGEANEGEEAGAARRALGECIPVLKPVPGCRLPDQNPLPGPPQVEILPLPTLQRLLSAQLPNTKLKLLRIPFHATWRQSLADFQ